MKNGGKMVFVFLILSTIMCILQNITGAGIATGIGTYICKYLQGLTIMGRPFSFPQTIGGYSLSLFLGVAMINLKLWQLTELALPMIMILLGQTILMIVISYFIIFNFMGRNYDAAVISSGFCGFGMGASPNAMANMQAVTTKYGPAPTAIFVVSIVAALFIDFTNSIVITAMMNIL